MEISIIKFLQAGGNTFYDVFFMIISYLASFLGFSLIIVIFFFFINKKYAIFMAGSYAITILLNYLIKVIVARPRPYLIDSDIVNKLSAMGHSMPSGHTASIVIISCFVIYYVFNHSTSKTVKWLTAVLMAILCGMVALSRMYLGQHYLSDTIVGALVGGIFSVFFIWLYEKKFKNIKLKI